MNVCIVLVLQPGCVNTTEVDIKKTCRVVKQRQINGRVRLFFLFVPQFSRENQISYSERKLQLAWTVFYS